MSWPDPEPRLHEPPGVDDVARMSEQKVDRIFSVRAPDDIKHVLALARAHGKHVSMRGTRHSMGGQTIAAGGYVIDLMRLNKWRFDPESELVTTQPGVKWSDLIVGLNKWGYSPRTMQSYSTFSVGGSLAVNAHGITTDFCMSEAVVRFTLIRWDGTELVCARDASGDAKELFGLALGGYGMFGIISEVTLKVARNTRLAMEMLQLRVDEFVRFYDAALADEDDDIEIKMARLNVTDLSSIDLFLFRRDQLPGMRTISNLGTEPHTMPVKQQILYKWILPQLKEVRYAVERATGKALDIEAEAERNCLMYESAEPLARLYTGLFLMEDTFVLQEFFVPKNAFARWVDAARPAYELAASLEQIELLNTTVRFVKQDADTLLAYSRAEEGAFAFVIYYRVHRSSEADLQLERVHRELTRVSLELGGSFYLPYRHHYTNGEMDAAFPEAATFFRMKQRYDPHCLFRSSWYERYGRRFWDDDAATAAGYECVLPSPLPLHHASSATTTVPTVSKQRNDSYKRLLRDPMLRAQFRDRFLTQIFNVEDSVSLYNNIAKVARDPRNRDDLDCFKHLQSLLVESSGALAMATKAWKQIKQLRAQKEEFLRETASVLGQLGRLGSIVGYVSIGDHGKMVLEYRRALALQGKVWVLHDIDADGRNASDGGSGSGVSAMGADGDEAWCTSGTTGANRGMPGCGGVQEDASGPVPPPSTPMPPPLPSTVQPPSPPMVSRIPSHRSSAGSSPEFSEVLERGSLEPVGEFVAIDYSTVEPLHTIPDGAADLITMHQGLHHLPQDKVMPFLSEVFRMLRPSGLFIVREHDASAELIPMLDMAHSIFNAVTGVSPVDESTEIRAFRPVLEWRSIIEAAGFVDTMVYEIEKGDPTLDEMMCFIKPCDATSPLARTLVSATTEPPPLPLHSSDHKVPPSSVPVQLTLAIDQIPGTILDLLQAVQTSLATVLPQLEEYVLSRVSDIKGTQLQWLSPETIRSFFGPLKLVVDRFKPLFERVIARSDLTSRLPLEEIFLVVRSLLLKGKRGEGTEMEMKAFAIIKNVQGFLGISDDAVTQARDESAAVLPQPDASNSSSGASTANSTIPQTPANELSAVYDTCNPDESGVDVQATALESLLRRLLDAKPELSHPNLLKEAGFAPKAVVVIHSKLDGVDVAAVSRKLSQMLDVQVDAAVNQTQWPCLGPRFEAIALLPPPNPLSLSEISHSAIMLQAFSELRAALEALVTNPDAPPFSYNRTGGIQEEGSLWHAAAMAVLGSPRVTFSQVAQTTASFMGLEPVVAMWRTARKAREAHSVAALQPSEARPERVALEPTALQQISDAFRGLETQQWKVTANLDNGQAQAPLLAVRQIRHARLQEKTIQGQRETYHEVECTDMASSALLEKIEAGPGYTLHLHGVQIDNLLLSLGLAPRNPSALHTQPGRGYKFGDLTRTLVRKVEGLIDEAIDGTVERTLIITLECCPGLTPRGLAAPDPEPDVYLPRVRGLLTRLEAHSQLRELHRDDGEYTWYKLNEWMQVEIIEAFGKNLSQVAWYRFPFVEMLAMYFRIFAKEAVIVQQKRAVVEARPMAPPYGFNKAFFSEAAITDVVPGIIMAFYFGQLHLLGAPLRALWGSGTTAADYEKEHTGDKAPFEQLVVKTGTTASDWRSVDRRIHEVRQVYHDGSRGLYTMMVPTFKPLTEVLIKLSQQPGLEVLQISNQLQVQMRVHLSRDVTTHEAQLDALRSKTGLEVMFDYSFPVDGSGQPPRKAVSLCVEVPYLLGSLRFCQKENIDIMQIYDFWS